MSELSATPTPGNVAQAAASQSCTGASNNKLMMSQSSSEGSTEDYIVIPSPSSEGGNGDLVSLSDLRFSLQSMGSDFSLEHAIDKVVELLKENQELKVHLDENTKLMKKQFDILIRTKNMLVKERSEMKVKFEQAKTIVGNLTRELRCKEKVIEVLMSTEISAEVVVGVEQDDVDQGTEEGLEGCTDGAKKSAESSGVSSMSTVKSLDIQEEINKLRQMTISLAENLEVVEGTRHAQEEIIDKLEEERQQLKAMVADLSNQLTLSTSVQSVDGSVHNGVSRPLSSATFVKQVESMRGLSDEGHVQSTKNGSTQVKSPVSDGVDTTPLGDHSKAAFESYVSVASDELQALPVGREGVVPVDAGALQQDESEKHDSEVVETLKFEEGKGNISSEVLEEAAQVSCNFMEELMEERGKVSRLHQQLTTKTQMNEDLQKKLQRLQQEIHTKKKKVPTATLR